ncbi:MAG: hypothetical protein AVDCRST_MAG72-1008 [uncultured Nocardioidaceae bacterium]|uniref:N-acetyltransferase domain-containing protein n=1 Tax=uncultured Nocardioidaceae bacterium TaxID=253824 RepID=A0A6J4M003_9ACTN|nr:MAG: hypothetical protein AVDCRST_MAG72-1008 [uncultured Nocardioidaceae bacterium]
MANTIGPRVNGLRAHITTGRVVEVTLLDVPTLTDGTVTLRGHREGDIAGVHEQCVDPLSQRWTTVPVPYTFQDARGFVTERVPSGWRDGSEWAFAVEADDEGTPRFAGTVSLRDEGDLRAEVAYGSHPWARGGGTMLRALNLLLDWGFADKHLRTVIWWANRGNWSSRRLAWRLGFSFDGTVRQWLPQRGELLDGWVGGLLAADPREPRYRWYDVPRIAGRSVALRAHHADDAARIEEACSDGRTTAWLARLPQPYTTQDALTFIDSRQEAAATGTGVHWAMADPDSDDLVGNISVFDLEAEEVGEIGYWTHPAHRGRGLMQEACALVVRHAFVPESDGGLGLRRLKVCSAQGNAASRHVIESCGFTQTGRMRGGIPLGDGSRADAITYDLLAEEYRR